MRGKNTIIINGKLYDAVSGLPVGAPDKPLTQASVPTPAGKIFSDIGPRRDDFAKRPSVASKSVHRKSQKSVTLRRDVLKKPKASANHLGSLRQRPSAGHVQKSSMISKFAAHPAPLKPVASTPQPVKLATKPSSHIARAHQLVAKPAATHTHALSSRALKEKLISEKLAEQPSTAVKKHSTFFARQPRAAGIVASCFALVVLGGYLTYLNMPNLSVRVAASQAGVAAKFPDYRPDGYRFNGPIAYVNGEVAIKFQANGGQGGYTIREQNSSWDSQAVYDNLVVKESNGSHITNSQGGLTVYTYKNKAAWVNAGVLYTVDGDAPLSNEQLLRIAGSM